MTRRFDETLQGAIEDLLRQEDSPQERNRLLINLQLVRAVADVTAASSELATQVRELAEQLSEQRERFEDHVQEQIKVLSQVTGAKRATMFLLPAVVAVAQLVLGYYVMDQRAKIDDISMVVRDTRDRTIENRARLDNMAAKVP